MVLYPESNIEYRALPLPQAVEKIDSIGSERDPAPFRLNNLFQSAAPRNPRMNAGKTVRVHARPCDNETTSDSNTLRGRRPFEIAAARVGGS